MMMLRFGAVLVAMLLAAGPAAAFQPLTQSGGGASAASDQQLSFRNGVVYDDDMVPGAATDQTYLGPDDGEESSGTYATSPGARQNSPQLIGPDGRIRATR